MTNGSSVPGKSKESMSSPLSLSSPSSCDDEDQRRRSRSAISSPLNPLLSTKQPTGTKLDKPEDPTHFVDNRRKIVVATFCASLVSFFGTGLYDYYRPLFVPHMVSILQRISISIVSFCEAKSLGCNVSAASTLKLQAVQTTLVVVAELSILFPAILFILPLTERWKMSYLTRRQLQQKSVSSEESCVTGSSEPTKRDMAARVKKNQVKTKVEYILSVSAWMLWMTSTLLLVVGVSVGPQSFGIISLSALICFFAQTVEGIGCLLLPYEEEYDDDIRRETESVEESSTNFFIPAHAWVQSTKGAGLSTEPKETSHGQVGAKVPASKVTNLSPPVSPSSDGNAPNNKSERLQIQSFSFLSGPARSLLHFSNSIMVQGRDLDFVVFLIMKLTLLQSPYVFQVGLHFLNSCIDCLHFTDRWDAVKEGTYVQYPRFEGDVSLPKEIPGFMALLCTVFVPLFTHAVGGKMFNGRHWSFHHPFKGGKRHVRTQASGWSLICVAGLFHLTFMMLGMKNQHVYLLHFGSVLSWCAEGLILFSLRNFNPDGKAEKVCTALEEAEKAVKIVHDQNQQTIFWLIMSYLQDLFLTNMHWLYVSWLIGTLLGFNAFSLNPFESFLRATLVEIACNMAVLILAWTAHSILIPYTPRRKEWKYNPIGLFNKALQNFLFHRNGLFSGSELRHEDSLGVYQRDGAMYGILPHGTLPSSVLPTFHQYDEIFADVCLFFGSQVSLVPAYKFMLGMRGGSMPVEKKQIIEVMKTRQNISLVPGGVSEMMKCQPHAKTINVSIKHKGFIRLAMQQGYDLIPAFFFHANDQYDNPMNSLQLWTYRLTGVPFGIPLYTNRGWLPLCATELLSVWR